MFQRMVPPKFSTHEDCREAVCCCCGVKTDKKRISVREEALVVEFAKKEYDSKVQSYPAGLCLNCRRGKILGVKRKYMRHFMRHFMGMRHFMRHFMRHLVKDQLSFIFNRSSAENP